MKKKPRFGRARLEFNTEKINVVFSDRPHWLTKLCDTSKWPSWSFPENTIGAMQYPEHCVNTANGDVVVTNDWLLMKEFELSCRGRVIFYNVTFDDKGAYLVTKCPKLDQVILGPIPMLMLAIDQSNRYVLQPESN